MDRSMIVRNLKSSLFACLSILLFLLTIVTSVQASETDSNYSFHTLIDKACTNNSELKAFHGKWKATVARFPASGSLPDPKMSIGWFLESVETRVGPQEWKASLSQTFPSGKKRSIKRLIAEQQAAIVYGEYLTKMNRLSENVANVLWEYDYLRHAIEIGESSIALLKNLHQVAITSYKAGKATQTDIIDITIAIDKADYRQERLKSQRQPLSSKIAELVNRPMPQPMPWPHIPKLPDHIECEELLLLKALGQNPLLTRNRSETNKTQFDFQLAETAREAEFTFGIEYISTGDAVMSGVTDSGKDPLIAKVSWNLPFGKRRIVAIEEEKRHLLQSTIDKEKQLENRIRTEISSATFKFDDTVRRENLYRNSLIPSSKQALDVSRNAFITGKLSFRDVTENEERYLEFQLALKRALADRGIALSQLNRLTGNGAIKSDGN